MYQPRSSCNTAHSQGQEKLGPFMPAVPKTIQWKGTSLGTIPNMGTDLSAPLSRPTQQHSVALGNELWQSSHDSDGSCHPQSSCKHRQISVWHRSHPFQAATFNFNLAKHAKQEIKNRKYIYMLSAVTFKLALFYCQSCRWSECGLPKAEVWPNIEIDSSSYAGKFFPNQKLCHQRAIASPGRVAVGRETKFPQKTWEKHVVSSHFQAGTFLLPELSLIWVRPSKGRSLAKHWNWFFQLCWEILSKSKALPPKSYSFSKTLPGHSQTKWGSLGDCATGHKTKFW